VVVARNAQSFDVLRTALKEHQLKKKYLLICSSEGLPDSGTIEFPLANHPKDKRRVYACIHPRDVARNEPRAATTHYRVVSRHGATGPESFKWALVEAEAPFALRHQIRAHFAALGHPLAGDELYGGEAVPGLERHALHASYVGHSSSPAFSVSSSLPPDLEALVAGDASGGAPNSAGATASGGAPNSAGATASGGAPNSDGTEE
jgi:23S rRNA pseudouridine1911/1915/1917 synthase